MTYSGKSSWCEASRCYGTSQTISCGMLPTLRQLASKGCNSRGSICLVPFDIEMDAASHLQMTLLEAYCREIGIEVLSVSQETIRLHLCPGSTDMSCVLISGDKSYFPKLPKPTAEVTFHFFGNSDDGDKIRESLNRLVQRRRLSEIALESTHFTFQQKPALKLQSLRINQVNDYEVHLGEQIVLSCAAQGSYSISFTWYKDGMLVNTSKATREIWITNLPNDGSDLYTSILTIEKATLLDAGQYTCQVVDWGVQQCKSIYIEVRDEPDVKVVPMSASIEKGNDIQLTCMTPNMRNIGIGFGWTKNRALLKLEPGRAVWEDLYPAGSILKITNTQKSAIYTCNVAHKSMSVRVEVMNRTLIPICFKEQSWGLEWPDTAPGSEALLECPRYFVGRRVSRLCSMKDATTPEWQIPDFSSCLYEPLILPYNNFRSLTLGYQKIMSSDTILAFWELLRKRALPLYPGEGDRIINMLAEIERYQHRIDPQDAYNSAETLSHIINRILSDEYSILSQEKLSMLLQLTQRNLIHWSKQLKDIYKHLSLSSMVVDIQQLQSQSGDSITHSLQIPSADYIYPDWYEDKVAIRLWKKKQRNIKSNNTFTGIVIVYKNMSRFIPTAYIKELDDGTDLEFRINSRMIAVAVPSFGIDKYNKIWVDLQIRHLQNQTNSWNTSCGLIDNTGSWDLDTCIANTVSGDVVTHCLCPTTGTIAVFLTTRAVKVVLAKTEQTTFIIIFGCSSCLVQCLLSALILGTFWRKHKSWLNFLKLQCCGALIGAMAIFIYAVHTNLPESSYSLVAIGLEAFLLVGMSAPISEALIVYAELTQIRPSQHLQPTVIAVITGVPILAVFATELTHKSTGWRHESWWLIYGSGVYNIFVSCATMMFLVFILLYMGVLHKVHTLVEENVMKREAIETRIRILHRAAIVICGIIAMEASSIFYINSSSVIFHYVFASLSFALGFSIIIAYIVNSENAIIGPMLRRIRWKRNLDDEHTSEPIKVCSKADAEVENDSATPPTSSSIAGEPYREARGVAAGSIDMREFVSESSSTYAKSSVPATRFLPEIRIDHSDNIDLENYNTSPRKYQEVFVDSTFSARSSCCVNDVVAYSVNERSNFRGDVSGKYRGDGKTFLPTASVSSESSAKVLCSADVESRLGAMPDVTLAVKSDVELSSRTSVELKSREHVVSAMPDIANTSERKQPDGEEKTPEIVVTTGGCDSATSGMLDRISHDLDYLLNRTHAKEGA
ncbi:Brain-specific angiogenesis inhibitor 1 [Trachymyrmex cornetzi]|uniref:Brain-specific angiogenesis inhibitor 1 n=1 Tax=Trachymyrmex cornetzi TaxID=471704 RepID=A0A195DB51_9HYME|nr:Brain-specific angiogenesis inhibitor 1 [Trachymyrmex cornetzi]